MIPSDEELKRFDAFICDYVKSGKSLVPDRK